MSPAENSSSVMNSSSSLSSSSMSVTLPPGLVFLVSNFHSFVNLKLDSTNYLLWRIQVENVMSANGFFDYLEGLIPCPAPQIKNAEGNLVVNPEYTLWKLIDTQLLTCITASLSPTTLPYILGLHTVHSVWESLGNRYNSLSHNHVQELKSKLYSITKTSTIEDYVDTIKEYTQKLIAAGSPIDEDDLIFHTLRGLPKVFNGLRTTVRAMITRGEHVTFDEVLNMLHAENQQLLLDSNSELDMGTVLVATNGQTLGSHGNNSSLIQSFDKLGVANQRPTSVQSTVYPSRDTQMSLGNNVGQMQISYGGNPQSVLGPAPQVMAVSSSSGVPQHMTSQPQFFPSNGFKGKGRRSPCAICGRTNHTTNYCYYRNPASQVSNQSTQWGHNQSVPWGNNQSVQWGPNQPMQWGNNQSPMQWGNNLNSSMQWGNNQSPMQWGNNLNSSIAPMYQAQLQPPPQPSQSVNVPMNCQPFTYQPSFSYPQSMGMSQLTSVGRSPQSNYMASSPQNPSQAHFAGFTDTSSAPITSSFSSQPQLSSGPTVGSSVSVGSHGSVQGSSPWYFDSGATNHITNNLQHVINPQPAAAQDGIMVGNGSHLQVSHTGTGQDYSSNLVPGTMSQGLVSSSDLL